MWITQIKILIKFIWLLPSNYYYFSRGRVDLWYNHSYCIFREKSDEFIDCGG